MPESQRHPADDLDDVILERMIKGWAVLGTPPPPSIIELRNNAPQDWDRCLFIWKETV